MPAQPVGSVYKDVFGLQCSRNLKCQTFWTILKEPCKTYLSLSTALGMTAQKTKRITEGVRDTSKGGAASAKTNAKHNTMSV